VGNRVRLADVGQELVAETFAFARTGDESGDIDERHGGWDQLFGCIHFLEFAQTGVRDGNDTGIWFDRGERVICTERSRVSQGVEKG
jgi:hypothetical protein